LRYITRCVLSLAVLTALASLVAGLASAPRVSVPIHAVASGNAMCLTGPWGSAAIKPGVPLEEAMREMEILLSQREGGAERYQPFAGRWGSSSDAGQPVTLTYSFPSDGVMVDGNINNGGDIQPNVLHARLGLLFGEEEEWKQYFRDMFDSWSAITGNVYLEVPDDNAAWGTRGPFHGLDGRGDIRIVMAQVSPGSFFAFNFFPENGDMVIDSFWPWGRFGGQFPEWRNMLAHEHGHGMGLFHSCPQDGTKLMEPQINTRFLGPQLDDALSGMHLYGDRFEPNDSGATSVNVEALGLKNDGPPLLIDGMSLHPSDDFDLIRVPSLGGTTLNFQVTPTGTTYLEGAQTSACDFGLPFDSLRAADLIVDVLRPNFAVHATFDAGAAGDPEAGSEVLLEEPGFWYLRVRAAEFYTRTQAYQVGMSVSGGGFAAADLSEDGCVDEVDLAILLAQWGTPGADLTEDELTNMFDLAYLLAAWTGPSCEG